MSRKILARERASLVNALNNAANKRLQEFVSANSKGLEKFNGSSGVNLYHDSHFISELTSTNSCGYKEAKIASNVDCASLPRTWYKKAVADGKVEHVMKFTECMTKPRWSVEYKGEEAALKTHKKKTQALLEKAWDEAVQDALTIKAFKHDLIKVLDAALLEAELGSELLVVLQRAEEAFAKVE